MSLWGYALHRNQFNKPQSLLARLSPGLVGSNTIVACVRLRTHLCINTNVLCRLNNLYTYTFVNEEIVCLTIQCLLPCEQSQQIQTLYLQVCCKPHDSERQRWNHKRFGLWRHTRGSSWKSSSLWTCNLSDYLMSLAFCAGEAFCFHAKQSNLFFSFSFTHLTFSTTFFCLLHIWIWWHMK